MSQAQRPPRRWIELGLLVATVLSTLLPLGAAGDSGGCSREVGTPTVTDGLPECGGADSGCYYCEYANPNGYTICSEAPDPGDGAHCVNVPQLPGHHPQNQVP